jgi:3-hydroxyisobutyrate dehydrogenase-like beta-hydroxyacid dehydrogenase
MQEVSSPSHTLAFLGFGEVAATFYQAGLQDIPGLEVKVCIPTDPSMWGISHELLANAGLTAHEDLEVLNQAMTVISLVPPAAALSVARKALPHLNTQMTYVDMNSIAAPTAHEIEEMVAQTGAHFVDAAILGAVPLHKMNVSIVLSGRAAHDFHSLALQWGFNTKVLSSRAGDASALKMLWSVITKGAIALFAEALVAAKRMQLDESLRDLLRQDFGHYGSDAMVLRLLRSTAEAGERRLGEMDEAQRTLAAMHVPSWTIPATQKWIETLDGMDAAAKAQDVETVLKEISEALSDEEKAFQSP